MIHPVSPTPDVYSFVYSCGMFSPVGRETEHGNMLEGQGRKGEVGIVCGASFGALAPWLWGAGTRGKRGEKRDQKPLPSEPQPAAQFHPGVWFSGTGPTPPFCQNLSN